MKHFVRMIYIIVLSLKQLLRGFCSGLLSFCRIPCSKQIKAFWCNVCVYVCVFEILCKEFRV